jgi:aminoglycoside phosphotransferase (APT) family kinase protein
MPLWSCEDAAVIGRPFFVMQWVEGTAAGHVLTRDTGLVADRAQLAQRLGHELARIHSIRPPRADLSFLPVAAQSPALAEIERLRGALDALPSAHPALEWGLRWLERHAPPPGDIVLCHGDYRTGNYLVDAQGLAAILDWEFAGWGDALQDIGWFCARCWRFGADAREAGGIGERADFYRGYERAGGAPVDDAQVRWWEVMAHVRWAVIALAQARRHASGDEPSLLLALTGRIVPELEHEVLTMTEPC